MKLYHLCFFLFIPVELWAQVFQVADLMGYKADLKPVLGFKVQYTLHQSFLT